MFSLLQRKMLDSGTVDLKLTKVLEKEFLKIGYEGDDYDTEGVAYRTV